MIDEVRTIVYLNAAEFKPRVAKVIRRVSKNAILARQCPNPEAFEFYTLQPISENDRHAWETVIRGLMVVLPS